MGLVSALSSYIYESPYDGLSSLQVEFTEAKVAPSRATYAL